MADALKCIDCKASMPGVHFNTKRCDKCVPLVLKRPKGTMTAAQIRKAKSLRGSMPRDEIAKQLGVSTSNLKRSCPGVSFYYFNRYAANPALVERVCRYYERHGKRKTQKRFPEINIRSIVERYKLFSPRQVRWTPEQIREAAQMAGIVSLKNQALYFSRPRAHRGSIISLWMKTFKIGGGNVNGLTWYIAKHFVRPACPVVETDFWAQRQIRRGKPYFKRRAIVLWKDFYQYQKTSNPDWIKDAARELSRFSEWLHGTKQVRRKVKKLIEERT